MDLTFNKIGNSYVAEFTAEADFNLHIERVSSGYLRIEQRTSASGAYGLVTGMDEYAFMKVIDVDFLGEIYPKFIKVVCANQPTYAKVVSSGEVTEIKSQSKEVEVTANGTTEVTPDAGFAYLNSVKVKTNVAQSGEGGGSQEGVKIGYYNAPKEFIVGLLGFTPIVYLIKIESGEIMPGTALIQQADAVENLKITSFAVIEPNTQYIRLSAEETPMSPNEFMDYFAGSGLGAATEITEEEFYTL
jgi:hypothetical protein